MPGRLLTQRQIEVIGWLNRGKNAQEVAEILCITKGTVTMHQALIYRKLEVHNLAAALGKARELGLLAEEEREPD